MVGSLVLNELANCLFNDVTDYIFGRVVNAAGLADFWLRFDASALVRGNNNVTEESFVDGAEDVNGDSVEIVWRIDVGNTLTYISKSGFVGLK